MAALTLMFFLCVSPDAAMAYPNHAPGECHALYGDPYNLAHEIVQIVEHFERGDRVLYVGRVRHPVTGEIGYSAGPLNPLVS